MPPNMVGIPLNEPIIPEEVHEPKGRRGRPRKTQESEVWGGMPPPLKAHESAPLSPGPMLIDKELKRPSVPGESPI